MKANQAAHSIATMCRVLGVSASGYYAWQRRGASARARTDAAAARADSRASIGSRAARMARRGFTGTCAPPACASAASGWRGCSSRPGLRGVSRRKWPVTTVRAAQARPAPDLVQRAFTATGPNQLWVADITYIPTADGLAVSGGGPRCLESPDRSAGRWRRTCARVWCSPRSTWRSRSGGPTAVIHHSDQGCQYTAIEFGRRCREADVRPSMGSVGDCYDNAMCESFFATLECELLDRVTLRTPAEARHGGLRLHRGLVQPDAPAFRRSTTCRRSTSSGRRAAPPRASRAARRPRRDDRPVEAAGPVDTHRTRPTGPWKTPRVSHSSHRPFFLVMTEETEPKALTCPRNRGNLSDFLGIGCWRLGVDTFTWSLESAVPFFGLGGT